LLVIPGSRLVCMLAADCECRREVLRAQFRMVSPL